MYWDHMTGWGWGMMVLWSVIWIALLGLAAWAIAARARATTPISPRQTEQTDSARRVLDGRLARGDIDVEEYERRRTAMERDFAGSTRT